MAYHEDAKIIEELGPVYLSERLGVDRSTVCNWRNRGIPHHAKQTLALMFPGKVPAEWKPLKASKTKSARR